MKKILLTSSIVTIMLGLRFSATVAPTTTVGQGSYQAPSSIKFEEGLPDPVAGTSFQSLYLEISECLSFGEIPLVDVSDVTLNSNRSHPSTDSPDPGIAFTSIANRPSDI